MEKTLVNRMTDFEQLGVDLAALVGGVIIVRDSSEYFTLEEPFDENARYRLLDMLLEMLLQRVGTLPEYSAFFRSDQWMDHLLASRDRRVELGLERPEE